MKCTNILIEDHRKILRSLDVLEGMARIADQGMDVEPRDVETLLEFLRLFGDDCHQAREESALFPPLMAITSTQAMRVRQMLFEHEQERSLVEGLEDALRTRKGKDFVYYADRLGSLLRTHIYKEENILFKIAEELLSNEQDEAVTAEFAKFQVSPRFERDLRELEWKYLRKTA